MPGGARAAGLAAAIPAILPVTNLRNHCRGVPDGVAGARAIRIFSGLDVVGPSHDPPVAIVGSAVAAVLIVGDQAVVGVALANASFVLPCCAIGLDPAWVTVRVLTANGVAVVVCRDVVVAAKELVVIAARARA